EHPLGRSERRSALTVSSPCGSSYFAQHGLWLTKTNISPGELCLCVEDIPPGPDSPCRIAGPVPKDLRGWIIHRKEALDADLLQGHVMRSSQGCDRGEQAERRLFALEVNDQDGGPGLSRRRVLGERGEAGEGEQPGEELGRLPRSVRDGVGLHAAKKVQGNLLPVHDEGSKTMGRHQ